MSRQFAGRCWKWVLSAGLAVGLAGFCAPCGWADDEKDEAKDKPVKKEVREEGDRKDVKKEGDREEVKKEGDRKEEVKKDGDRKEEGKEEIKKDAVKKDGEFRKDEIKKDADRKDEIKKDYIKKEASKDDIVKKGSGDGRIDELAYLVKQLSGQVEELRQEVRSLRGGGPNPEEMRKHMAEMAKKFGEGGLNNEKLAEMKRRAQEEMERARFRGKEGGGDPEAQIRREIERLNAELKKVLESKDREGIEKKKEAGREEERKVKEGAESKEGEAKERAIKEAKEREAKEREEKKPDAK